MCLSGVTGDETVKIRKWQSLLVNFIVSPGRPGAVHTYNGGRQQTRPVTKE